MATRNFNRRIWRNKGSAAVSGEGHSNEASLVDFLAAAQTTQSLIMRVAPYDGQQILGNGLSGTVEQSSLNAEVSLAYKQGIPSRRERDGGDENDWASLVRELTILQHQSIKINPCFYDIIGVSFIVKPDHANHRRAWPVIISTKVSQGELGTLILDKTNVLADEARLRLFAQVSEAVQTLHSSGVGHGDIKPNNFLISKSLDGILSCIMIDFGSSVIRGERRFPTRNDLWSPLELDSMSHLVGFDEIKQADLFAYGLLALHLLIPHETLLKFGLWLLRDPEVSVAKWNEQVGLIKQLKTEDPYSDLSLASKASRSVNESNLSALARSVLLEIIEKTLRPLHGERTLPWHRVKSMVERYLYSPSENGIPRAVQASQDSSNHDSHQILDLEKDLIEFDDGDYVVRQNIHRDIEHKAQYSLCPLCREEYSRCLLLCCALNMGGIDDAHYSYHTNESPEFLGVAFSRISANYRLETNSEKSDLSAYGIHAIPKYDQIEEYEMTGRLNEAESMLKKEIEARDQIFGSSSLCTLVLLTDLARVLEKHNLEEAEQQQRRLIGGLARYLGKQHRRWAEAQMHLAGMLDNRGSRQESVDIFRNVFQARQETHTFDDLHTLNAGIELSWALAKHQQLEEAQELIERMIDGMSKQQGARHPWTIHAKFYHVRILRARRYFDVEWEALNSLEKDLKEITEGNKLQKCRLVLERANHFKDLEKLDQAELAALDAIKIVTKLKLLGGSDLHLATLRTLATIQGEKGDRLQEEVSLRQIVTFEGSRSGEGPLVWNTKHQLAACLKSQARLGEAFHVAGEVLEASKGAIKRDSNSIIGCMIIQSSVLQSMGSIKEAAELLQIASNKCKLELGNEHLHTISLEYHLASIFFTAGNMEKAVFVYEEILPRLLRKHHPQVSPHDIMCLLEQALIVIGEHDKAQKYRDMMGVGSLCAASPVDCSLEACAISGSMALTPS